MKIEVTQCSMCTHYNTEQYCEVWEQYITNDAFYCACGVRADRKTEPQTEMEKSGSRAVLTARCLNCHNAKACKENHWEGCKYEPWKLTAVDDEPQTDCGWK